MFIVGLDVAGDAGVSVCWRCRNQSDRRESSVSHGHALVMSHFTGS